MRKLSRSLCGRRATATENHSDARDWHKSDALAAGKEQPTQWNGLITAQDILDCVFCLIRVDFPARGFAIQWGFFMSLVFISGDILSY